MDPRSSALPRVRRDDHATLSCSSLALALLDALAAFDLALLALLVAFVERGALTLLRDGPVADAAGAA
jgi:hypothetical protein